MRFVRLNVLGRPEIVARSGQIVDVPRSCHPLLGFLVANWQRGLDRAELADMLWPDYEGRRARRCLATALWRLRALPGLAEIIHPGEGSRISVNLAAPVLVDVVAFERRIAQLFAAGPSPAAEVLRRAARAIALYRADPFARIDAHWALVERERLRLLLVEGLARLAKLAAERGDVDGTIRHASRLVAIEPLREDAHRLMICAYLKKGARAKAIGQFERCREELSATLGIEPMEETRQLYESIVAGPAAAVPQEDRAYLGALTERVRRARKVAVHLTQELDAALRVPHDRRGRLDA